MMAVPLFLFIQRAKAAEKEKLKKYKKLRKQSDAPFLSFSCWLFRLFCKIPMNIPPRPLPLPQANGML